MRNFTCLLIICLAYFFSVKLALAQDKDLSKGSWQNIQIEQAKQVYEQQFSGINSPVYHGYQYVPFILPATGNPFYPSNKWHQGTVDFEGKVYNHLFLLYDILKDQLVLQSAKNKYWILLSDKKVSRFTLDSLYFIKIVRNDSSDRNTPPSGYYERLINGEIKLFVKRKKTVVMPTSPGQSRSFDQENTYYIKKENTYYKVRTKHAVLKVLTDKKRAVRRYLRKNHIYFQDRENAIIKAVAFYNKIKANA